MIDERRERTRAAFELAASMLQTGASISPAFGFVGLTAALEGLAAVARAAETAIRDQGVEVEEIVARIHMPRKLGVDDFRHAIDERIREKPEKG